MKRRLARLRRAVFGSRPDPVASEEAARAARFRALAHAGDLARNSGDWSTAAARYGEALAIEGDHAAIRVQYGHVLKETGRLLEAEAAYRTAAASAPEDADIWVQLAHVLKIQRRPDAAMDAYLEALRRDPALTAVRNEVIAAGGRDRLDEDAYGRSSVATRLARLSSALDETLAQVRDGAIASAFPVAAYDAFRRQYPIQPPPGPSVPLLVLVDAVGATGAALRLTLTSLMDQRVQDWRAMVISDPQTSDHPVAGLAQVDARIAFHAPEARGAVEATMNAYPLAVILTLSAGALLDPEAVGWFGMALARTGATAVYADHDHFETHWRTGPVRFHPVLQSMADRRDVAGSPHPPAAVGVAPPLRQALLARLSQGGGAEGRRDLLLEAISHGPVAHLPRVLTGLPLPESPPRSPRIAVEPAETDSRILVVIPTRDEPRMLKECLTTLRACAARPDRLDILVVDNRSTEPETRALFADLSSDEQVRILPMDEPFNWARLNNEAAASGSQELLVFANNDIEMTTRGWDDRLRTWLEQPDVGVVGARLLYPDGALQHGGILLGSSEGRPFHDGLWAPGTEGGPLDRWRRSRAVAAVTGAFMACRRDTFQEAGGFNPRLAIAYNDIDFCLRVRALGMTVVYAADVEMLHHESRTRGQNDTAEKVAWDDEELAELHRRWGDALFLDPGLNPQWASSVHRPFDGYREPPLSQILMHLDRSAARRPWALESAPQNPV